MTAAAVKRFTGIDCVHEHCLDVDAREIYLFGREEYISVLEGDEPGVEFGMANRLIKNLRILQGVSSAPILIHMKTCGGYWHEGMAIYQAIKSCPCFVTILNYTHARSMSSIILQAADRRVMMPYSVFMFHDGTVSTSGTFKNFITSAEQSKIELEQMFDIYLDKAVEGVRFQGKKRAQIKSWMRSQMDRKEDVFLSAKEAIECGFADSIFGESGKYDWAAIHG